MSESLEALEDLLFELRYPILASGIIIDLLTNDCDTGWEVWHKSQSYSKYNNYKSLIYTLNLLNKRASGLSKIYNRKVDYLYKQNRV